LNSGSVGRLCIYCSKPMAMDERIAVCDRCYAAHHEECWDRNGRCSTFRCAGLPRTMTGADLSAVLKTALEKANEQPENCPFCTNKAYPGILQGKWTHADKEHPAGPGLLFIAKPRPESEKAWFGKKLVSKMKGNRSWFLPGAVLRTRSCGKCKRLYLWGVPVDETFVQKLEEDAGEKFCPHCASTLWRGAISLDAKAQGGAKFECADTPDFHKDWLGHNLLDRFVLNKWALSAPSIPACSCESCQYTEIGGRPVYRVL
jgi:hypothetical protein